MDDLFPEIVGTAQHSFLKLDVQGYEKWVLQGARRSLPKIDLIQLKLSLSPIYESEMLLAEGIALLGELGFDLVGLIPEFGDERGRL